ncbi:MAG TPA: DUF4148 domain-containing protein [Planctomycetaceae bacterium]|jgi:hypothetical protein|nr:DUF4148 domain-containing protein [Planctomycetaceae bacterium]
MNRQLIAQAVVGLLLCGNSVSLPTLSQAAEPAVKPLTRDEVIKSLEAREKALQMVELRWVVDHHYEVGGCRSAMLAEQMHLRGKALKTGIPAEPVTFHYSNELRLKGDATECSSKTFRLNGPDASMSLIPYRTSYDGRVSKFLAGTDPAQERSMLEATNTNVGTAGLLPILMYYRPLAEKFAVLDKAALKICDQSVVINGHQCVRVGDGDFRVCLDRDRNLIPIAFQRFRSNGERTLDVTIDYATHRTLYFVPKHFAVKHYLEPSKLSETIAGDIVETHWGRPAH